MAVNQHRSTRKTSGGRYKKLRVRRLHQQGSLPTLTKVGPTKKKNSRVRGGNISTKLLTCDTANVLDPKTKKFSKEKIKGLKENPANRHFVRRSIITKGSIIETEKGLAKVTSRPGQEGTVNAVRV